MYDNIIRNIDNVSTYLKGFINKESKSLILVGQWMNEWIIMNILVICVSSNNINSHSKQS